MSPSEWNYLYTVTDSNDQINRVIFSPNGQAIAGCSFYDSHIYIWRTMDGKLINAIWTSYGSINDISFSPNGEYILAGCEDKTLRLFRVSDGKLIDTLAGHSDEVWRVAYSQDGRNLASISKDGTLKVWKPLIVHRKALDNVLFEPFGSPNTKFSCDAGFDPIPQ